MKTEAAAVTGYSPVALNATPFPDKSLQVTFCCYRVVSSASLRAGPKYPCYITQIIMGIVVPKQINPTWI